MSKRRLRIRTRIKRFIKDAVIVMAGFLVVVGLFYVATTPVISAERQQVKLSYSHSFKTLNDTRSLRNCGKAVGGFDAKAAIGHEHLFGGGMSIRFCWRIVQGPMATDLLVGTPHVNTWADARWGWSYDGISSKVRGHGKKCANGHCWQYRYWRYYYKFTRGIKGIQQTCTPYINITIRATGWYIPGHSDGGIC
jgi:hypothetical protein